MRSKPSPRPFNALRHADLQANPVWKSQPGDAEDAMLVPVSRRPVTGLDGYSVAAHIQTSSGVRVVGLLSNLFLDDPLLTQHMVSLSVLRGDTWFHMRRYFDPGVEQLGPRQLSQFLAMPMDQVFPLQYDISAWVPEGAALKGGLIEAVPAAPMASKDLMRLFLTREIRKLKPAAG